MARHVGDRLLISYLVGASLNTLANKRIEDILSRMPDDLETLTWLKDRVFGIASRTTTIKGAINSEREIALQQIRKERIGTILDALGDMPEGISKESIEKIRNGDEEFFRASREYYSNFMTSQQATFDLPYPQSRKQLEELHKKATKEAAGNPAAILSAALWPSVTKICSIEVRTGTHFNALEAAIEIYMVKAKTGLPDSLPAGLPKDLFSGEDFEYEKSGDGFVLRCRGKDLDKDEIYQYEFKVRK